MNGAYSGTALRPAPRLEGRGRNLGQPVVPALPTTVAARSSFIMMLVTCLLIFNHFGRPFEYVLVGYKIPAVICGLGILAVLAGGYLRMFRSRVGIFLLMLVIWMLLATPFSSWKGGSVAFDKNYIQFWVVLFLMTAGAPKSVKDINWLATLLGFACIFHLVVFGGTDPDGRFQLAGSSYGNSDDVALLAGFAIPFVIFATSRLKNRLLRYPVLIAGVGFLFVTTLRTATRTAIPALLLMIAVYFLRGGVARKAAVFLFVLIGSVAALFVLPSTTLSRLASLGHSFDMSGIERQTGSTLSEADDSLLERRRLLEDAVKMTLEHPLFGVGPGEFVDYRTKALEGTGDHTHILPSHNTYLQVASELGFAGFFIYLAFLIAIFITIRRIRKLNSARLHPEWQAISQAAVALEAALAYFVVCATFMTCDRHPEQFLLAGIAIALEGMLVAAQSPLPQSVPGTMLPRNSAPGIRRLGNGKPSMASGY